MHPLESPCIPSFSSARFNIWFLENLYSNRSLLDRTSHSALIFYTLISTHRFLCIYHLCGGVGRGASRGECDDDEGGTIGLLQQNISCCCGDSNWQLSHHKSTSLASLLAWIKGVDPSKEHSARSKRWHHYPSSISLFVVYAICGYRSKTWLFKVFTHTWGKRRQLILLTTVD